MQQRRRRITEEDCFSERPNHW